MAFKTYIINSNQAQYTDEEFSAVQSELYSEGVFNDVGLNTDLKVTQNSPADLSVLVNTGGALLNYTKSGITWKVVGKSNTVATVTVPTNGGGSNRVDAIVVHFKQDEPNSLKNNVMEVIRVAGTGITALTDGAIDTAVGDTNWYRLANVTVIPAATQIFNANITDTRSEIEMGANDGVYRTLYRGDASQMFGILKNPLDSDMLVDTDNAYDMGSAAFRFKDFWTVNMRANNLFGDGSNVTNVSTNRIALSDFVLGEDFPFHNYKLIDQAVGTSLLAMFTVNWFGQTFTVPAGTTFIDSIVMKLQRVGAPAAGNITLYLHNTTAGLPTGAALGSVTYTNDFIHGSQPFDHAFIFASPIAVTPGTQYAIVIEMSAVGNAPNCININFTNTNPYAGGTQIQSVNSGATWAITAGNDLRFKVYGSSDVKYPVYVENGQYTKLIQHYNVTENNLVDIFTTTRMGCLFRARGMNFLSSYRCHLNRSGAPGGTFNLDLFLANANGDPTGASLHNFNIAANTIQAGAGGEYRDIPVNIALTENAWYVIAASLPAVGDGANNIDWFYNTVPTQTELIVITSSDGGVTYNPQGGTPHIQIFGHRTRTVGRAYRVNPLIIDNVDAIAYPATNAAVAAGNPKLCVVQGETDAWGGLTVGSTYYLSPTGTNIQTGIPTIIQSLATIYFSTLNFFNSGAVPGARYLEINALNQSAVIPIGRALATGQLLIEKENETILCNVQNISNLAGFGVSYEAPVNWTKLLANVQTPASGGNAGQGQIVITQRGFPSNANYQNTVGGGDVGIQISNGVVSASGTGTDVGTAMQIYYYL